MKVGFDFDDTINEHVPSFRVQRGFLIRAVTGMIAYKEFFIISARQETEKNRAEIMQRLYALHVKLLPENLFLGFSGVEKAKLAETLGIRIFSTTILPWLRQ
jgi:hypothetical protein